MPGATARRVADGVSRNSRVDQGHRASAAREAAAGAGRVKSDCGVGERQVAGGFLRKGAAGQSGVAQQRRSSESESVPVLSMPPPQIRWLNSSVSVLSVTAQIAGGKIRRRPRRSGSAVAGRTYRMKAPGGSCCRIAPPKPVATLFAKLVVETVRLPVVSLATPPPKAAELPVIARLERLSVPELSIAPPLLLRGKPACDRQAGDRGGHSRSYRENASNVVSADRE